MKTTFNIWLVLLFLVIDHGKVLSQGFTIPGGDADIADSISSDLPAPLTAEELATPPPGEIRRIGLRSVGASRAALQAVLAAVPTAEHSNPSYNVASLALQKLDLVIQGRRQDQLFGLIEHMAVLHEAASIDSNPHFVREASAALRKVKMTIIDEMAAYALSQNAVVSPTLFLLFVDAFNRCSILEMGDWEDKPIPFSEAELMIIDPIAVVARIKTQPWENAERFLGGATATKAFSQYASSGDGSLFWKNKFLGNEANITGKWNELAAWVAREKTANQ